MFFNIHIKHNALCNFLVLWFDRTLCYQTWWLDFYPMECVHCVTIFLFIFWAWVQSKCSDLFYSDKNCCTFSTTKVEMTISFLQIKHFWYSSFSGSSISQTVGYFCMTAFTVLYIVVSKVYKDTWFGENMFQYKKYTNR